MTEQDLQIAITSLYGNPHWDTFLEWVAELQEAALWDLENFENLNNPGVLQRTGGILSVTRQIKSLVDVA